MPWSIGLRTRLSFYRAKRDPANSLANNGVCPAVGFQFEMSVSICKERFGERPANPGCFASRYPPDIQIETAGFRTKGVPAPER